MSGAVAERGTVSEAELMAALATVRDPELDQDVVSLRFVGEIAVDGGRVEVHLRLPTYFCAPNFAFLMAADAQVAVEGVSGVSQATIVLDDHHASEPINDALSGGTDFDAAFGDEAGGEGLEELRSLFRRKAFVARQQRLCERLLKDGSTRAGLAVMQLGDVPGCEEKDRYLERRLELGIEATPAAPLVVTPAGDPVGAERIEQQLRIGRSVRVSLDGNAGLCAGLLESRYGLAEER